MNTNEIRFEANTHEFLGAWQIHAFYHKVNNRENVAQEVREARNS